jgi:50S ribosomal protein L16 3-hydroxylase
VFGAGSVEVGLGMNLQTLLGEFPVQRFVADNFHRFPYSAVGLASSLCELGTWDSLTAILKDRAADVLVCRRNEQNTGNPPQSSVEAQELVNDGYTLLVRHAERHDARLAEVAAAFARDLASAVNIHMYCTPGGQYGFGWHYDAEEVFIVQTTGRKQYSLRKNTVNPWPIEETLPADMKYEREIMPLMRCELAAADWLYIPSGYWHMGESRQTAISLAIGVQPHTPVEVFDFLRPAILDSILWRQRLPVVGEAANLTDEALREQCAAIMKELGADLGKRLSDPRFLEALLAKLRTIQSSPQLASAAEQVAPTS